MTDLIEEGKFKSAYRYLVMNGEYSCGSYRYAEVLKWNGRYEESLEILQGEQSEEAVELRHELEGFLGIKKKDELYSVRAFGKNDSVSQTIFAVLNGPILIRREEVQTSYFPRKTSKEMVYFELEGADSTFFAELNKEFSRVQEKHMLKISTGWITDDTLLYYSAFHQAPLASAGFHDNYGIYTWNGKKHELLKWIDKKSAYVHPTVTKDGWLIFSSDREGGYGGMDLWKMNLNVDEGEPINLGADVNSEFDELYPSEAGDSLYFVTNNPERSIGGFDVLLFHDGRIANPGEPLNSVSDDFNPYTVKGELAFISTDRLFPDSLDLVVKVKPFKSRLLFDLIHGEVENDEIVAGDKVELLDSDGNLLDYTYVNKDGRFTFASIKGLEGYTISFTEGKLSEGDKVRLFDKNFGLMEELELDESGQAKFELLTPADYSLDKVVNTDESMLSVDISGFLSGSSKGTQKGVEIYLQDSEGTTIARAFTNDKGEFTFEQVRPDEAYSFTSAVIDMNSEIRIFNQNGEVIESIKPDESGEFVYVRLKESDKIITITNEDNVTVKLAEEEKFNLPSIYFELDESMLGQRADVVLNKLISILEDNPHVAIKLAGHTDSKGEAAYNLKLSQQRIESVKKYLVQSGIDSSRISGEGFGETRLVNKCADGIECTDEEHAENRRIEVQFYSTK
ncbi:OmpA family protein [Cryomorphaceae bacterium 1068]|nr:OmpA family protein [Cryomorphaceae bacterium 1068]